jgi:hypothetical protein
MGGCPARLLPPMRAVKGGEFSMWYTFVVIIFDYSAVMKPPDH